MKRSDLKTLRENNGLSLHYAARYAMVSADTIQRVEGNRPHKLQKQTAKRLAQYIYNIPCETLVTLVREEQAACC